MTEQAISPLRRRMTEDMSIRKLAAKTQHVCVHRVKNFAAFLGRSPDTAKSEDVRRFRLHLASSGAGTPAGHLRRASQDAGKVSALLLPVRESTGVIWGRVRLVGPAQLVREHQQLE
jgi:hypothetical protein